MFFEKFDWFLCVILWFYVAVFAVCCWSLSFLWTNWSRQGQQVNTEIGFWSLFFFLVIDVCYVRFQLIRMNVSISSLRDDVYGRRCFFDTFGFRVTNLYLWKLSQSDLSISMHMIFDWIEATRRWQENMWHVHFEAMIAFSEGIVLTALMFFFCLYALLPSPKKRTDPSAEMAKMGWTGRVKRAGTDLRYLEDYPMTCKWLITMVIVSPHKWAYSPFKWPI